MITLDTETTGLRLHHGCKPFFVSLCNGPQTYWYEWPVDPSSREPQVKSSDLEKIRSLLQKADRIVLHNAKFDIRALASVGLSWEWWDKTDDTQILSHVFNSAGTHKLKELAILYLDINDKDQSLLQEAIVASIKEAKKHGIPTANKEHPTLPHCRGPWYHYDNWLPKYMAAYLKLPKSHPWWTVLQTYGKLDAVRTYHLWEFLYPQIKKQINTSWSGMQCPAIYAYERKRKLLRIIYDVESRGIHINEPAHRDAMLQCQGSTQLYHDTGIALSRNSVGNLASSKQVQGLLYGSWRLTPPEGSLRETGYSVDEEAVLALKDALPRQSRPYAFLCNLMKYRKATKQLEYLEAYRALLIKGRLRPGFNIVGTATTRLSSSDPNAQNIGKKEKINIRRIFGPEKWKVWYSIDYDNIEMRLFAYLSGDEEMIAAYERGESVHLVIAAKLHPKLLAQLGPNKFKERDEYSRTKNGNFALIYGAGQREANATYRVPDAYRTIRKTMPKIDSFMNRVHRAAIRDGKVTTLGGYPLLVPHDRPHVCVNYLIQGSAGDYLAVATIAVEEYLRKIGWGVIMTIHDELIMEAPVEKKPGEHAKPIAEIKRLMETPSKLFGIPVPASLKRISKTWDKKESV